MSIMFTGLIMFIYVVFNWAFHNPSSGAFTKLDELRPTLLGGESSWAQDILNFNHNIFGMVFVALIVVNIACALIDVLRNKNTSLE